MKKIVSTGKDKSLLLSSENNLDKVKINSCDNNTDSIFSVKDSYEYNLLRCRSLVRGYVKDKSEGNNDNKHVYVPYDIITVLSTYLHCSLANIADAMNNEFKSWSDNLNKAFFPDPQRVNKAFSFKFYIHDQSVYDQKQKEYVKKQEIIFDMQIKNYRDNYVAESKNIPAVAQKLYICLIEMSEQNRRHELDRYYYYGKKFHLKTTSTKDTLKFSLIAMNALTFQLHDQICKSDFKQMIDSNMKIFKSFHFNKYLKEAIKFYSSYMSEAHVISSASSLGNNYCINFEQRLNKNLESHYLCDLKVIDSPVKVIEITIYSDQHVYFQMVLQQEKKSKSRDNIYRAC
ncbi:MAG: hypothetical protein GY730_09705 [bacterium]|nr:hypothetical protein [bacterium]